MVRTAPLGPCSRDPDGTNDATPSPSGRPHPQVKLDAPAAPLEERVSRRQAYGRGKSPFLRWNAVSETLATSGPPDGSCASHSDTGLSSATFATPWETPQSGVGG